MQRIVIPISPARHAAQMGLILGGYLSCIYIFFMYTPSYPLLSLAFFGGLLGLPFVAYFLGRKFRDVFPREVAYPFVIGWSHGVQMFVFAGAILLVPQYFYYTQVLPKQIPHIEQMLNQLYGQSPESRELLRELYGQDPIELLQTLTGRSKLLANLWSGFSSTVFLGALVSLINALILKRKAH